MSSNGPDLTEWLSRRERGTGKPPTNAFRVFSLVALAVIIFHPFVVVRIAVFLAIIMAAALDEDFNG